MLHANGLGFCLSFQGPRGRGGGHPWRSPWGALVNAGKINRLLILVRKQRDLTWYDRHVALREETVNNCLDGHVFLEMFQSKNHVSRTLAQLRWLSLFAFGPEALDAKLLPSSRMLRETCPSPRCSSETCILLHKSRSYACLWRAVSAFPSHGLRTQAVALLGTCASLEVRYWRSPKPLISSQPQLSETCTCKIIHDRLH